jgi:hypothetical protein
VIRTLAWKEFREQLAPWLALTLLAAGGSVAVAALLPAGLTRDGLLMAVLWLTAWGYGLVCGALLLAGETEGATQAFLDALPVTRRQLWRAKASVGLAFVAAQLAVLVTIGLTLNPSRFDYLDTLIDLAATLLCGGAGYAWGLYCGASASSVLGAIARGALLQALSVAAVYFLVAVTLLAFGTVNRSPHGLGLLALTVLVAVGAAVRSREVYCRSAPSPVPAPRKPRPTWFASRAEQLLKAGREARPFAIGMALYGLVGIAALALLGAASWPVLTLLGGVACGVTSLACEPGWKARAVVRFAIGVGSAGVMALAVLVPYVIRLDFQPSWLPTISREVIPVSAVSALGTDPFLFLTLWFVQGFAAGLLAGALLSLRLPAAALGLTLASLFGGVWLPTVYVGGALHGLQMWAAPPAFGLATYRLDRYRVAGRLTALRAIAVTAVAFVVAGLMTAASLWERVIEMPAAPAAVDVDAFLASLPTPEENVGGRLTSSALRRLDEIAGSSVRAEIRPQRPGGRSQSVAQLESLDRNFRRVHDVNIRGWRDRDRDLRPFLDEVFGDAWARDLAEAAGHPTGLAEDPRTFNRESLPTNFGSALDAASLLVARGLQRQYEGEPEVFVDNLRTGLAVACTLRHLPAGASKSLEQPVAEILSRGVEHWLERLDGRPDLLRRALETLRQHLAAPARDPNLTRNAEFLVAFKTFAEPANLNRLGNGADPFFSTAPADTTLLRLARRAPWERVRFLRYLQALASGNFLERTARQLAPEREKDLRIVPLALDVIPFTQAQELAQIDFAPIRSPQVAALQVALRLYQEEKGRPAEGLTELVPDYLPAVPEDPADGRPYRYRLSRGETLYWAPETMLSYIQKPDVLREVPAGQGILWRVGRSGRDHGGHAQEINWLLWWELFEAKTAIQNGGRRVPPWDGPLGKREEEILAKLAAPEFENADVISLVPLPPR